VIFSLKSFQVEAVVQEASDTKLALQINIIFNERAEKFIDYQFQIDRNKKKMTMVNNFFKYRNIKNKQKTCGKI